ncbi:MAG: acyltransferase [Lysobacterales bacterium]
MVFRKLAHALKGLLALLAITVNTVVLSSVIVILALFKLLLPQGAARRGVTHFSSILGEFWVAINQFVLSFYRKMRWDISLPSAGLDHGGRYLVFCNHQSWVDIMVLQFCLNRKAPFMRFLLKQELIWVPFLGLAWWALDMAFLRRYSREALIRNPSLRGKDLENAARACEKLKHIPVSMMAFPEGTRFTPAKQRQQKSPYRHLLRPRHGGIGQVLYSFGDSMQDLIDVTIFYPDGVPSFWQFISGQVGSIRVRAHLRRIDAEVLGRDFRSDKKAKQKLKAWLERIWAEKDREFDSFVREQHPAEARGDEPNRGARK